MTAMVTAAEKGGWAVQRREAGVVGMQGTVRRRVGGVGVGEAVAAAAVVVAAAVAPAAAAGTVSGLAVV